MVQRHYPHAEALAALDGVAIRIIRNRGPYDLLSALTFARVCSRVGAEVVILHGNRALRAVGLARRLLRVPSIARNGTRTVGHAGWCERVINPSEHMSRACVTRHGMDPRRVRTIPNPPVARGPDAAPPVAFHDPPVIGLRGRTTANKGLDVLIDALGLLRSRGVAFEARIAGDGPDRAGFERQAETLGLADRVRFEGWASDPATFFVEIDVYAFPSRHEPFGIALLEAFLWGRPAVVARSEGPSEFATCGEDCLCVPTGDADALARALARVFSEPDLAARLGRAARAKATGRLGWDAFRERLGSLVDELAAGTAA